MLWIKMKKVFLSLVLMCVFVHVKAQTLDSESTAAGIMSAGVLQQHVFSQAIDTLRPSDSGVLSIDFDKPVKFLLFSFAGKRIFESKVFNGKMDYDVSHLPSGVYFVVYSDGQKAIMQQILIMKQPQE
jgi:hypothetical protein